MKYCLDTSALIEPWVRLYPPDVFGPIWAKLSELAEAGIVASPDEVRIEINRQSDDLAGWVKTNDGLFLPPDRALMEGVARIANQFPGFIKPNSTKSAADPFVVALAQIHKVPVVTYETHAKKDAAPKIPNVCDGLGIKSVTLIDVLRAEGFKL